MNIAIISVLLKSYVAPWIEELEYSYPSPSDKLEAIRNMASDEGNDEIVGFCDYIEKNNLIGTFFRE